MNMKIYMNYTSIVKHILFKSEFFGYTLIIQNKLLKLSQLERMIRVYINYGVKMNDYRLCESIIDRSKFRKTIG